MKLKDYITDILKFIAIIAVLSGAIVAHVSAAETDKPFRIYTTAYMETGNLCYSGCKPRYGIAAGKKEWIGLTAIIYKYEEDGSIGEVLGHFEILDTGFGGDADNDGIGSIQEGKCIDIFQPDLEACKAWMELTGGKCYIQLVDAKG